MPQILTRPTRRHSAACSAVTRLVVEEYYLENPDPCVLGGYVRLLRDIRRICPGCRAKREMARSHR
ncbi:MAG: hypothetical protein NTY77_05520 [Elusimicrobia bacterium]|nr:hypothetical protein [Elusimicrobiota bacterium]